MKSYAVLSKDRVYRFKLGRVWNESLPILPWVLHNPSKADERINDPTVLKVIGFSSRLGYGGCEIYNGIPVRATDPKDLLGTDFNLHENERHLAELCHKDRIICAWGNTEWASTFRSVIALLERQANYLWCLGKTLSGNPKHPVRLGYATQLERFGDH
jgi:hypothetical protein